MSWLKRIEPITLEQSSDIPYIILENGVFLCSSNIFVENADKLTHFLKLKAEKNDLICKSTNCYAFKEFPILISFDNIIKLNNVIANGRVIKQKITSLEEPKNIVIATSTCLQKMNDNCFQEFIGNIENYDFSFLLIENEINSQDRLLQEMTKFIIHDNWYKTSMVILNHIYNKSHYKYCWTKILPELKITFYGLKNSEEAEKILRCLEDIGISEKEITWI